MRTSWIIPAAASLMLGLCQCQKAGPVVWPEVSALDELAEKAEGLAEQKDLKGMRSLAPALRPIGMKVVEDPVPSNVQNPAAVAQLLHDLKDLMTKLDKPEALSDADLQVLVAGVHPIVEELILKAGMPHVHEKHP